MYFYLYDYEQKYPPSATTLHFEFYAEPGPEVKVDRKVKVKQSYLIKLADIQLIYYLRFYVIVKNF